jgi:hypothetical protein
MRDKKNGRYSKMMGLKFPLTVLSKLILIGDCIFPFAQS